MKDEILIEEKIGELDEYDRPLYIVTSVHAEAINNMVRNKTIDDTDLESLKQLGFAVALNKLDRNGEKVYIKHNARTFAGKIKSRNIK
tara:strand:+ start:223 stop:486 length:264 start_codon:yes stop_codon:yes gene_type:complete